MIVPSQGSILAFTVQRGCTESPPLQVKVLAACGVFAACLQPTDTCPLPAAPLPTCRAVAWRTQVLSTLCSDALISIGEVMHSDRLGQRPLGQTWHFRLPPRSLPVKASGAPGDRGAAAAADREGGAVDVVDLLSRPPVMSCIQPPPQPMPRMSMAGGAPSPAAAAAAGDQRELLAGAAGAGRWGAGALFRRCLECLRRAASACSVLDLPHTVV